MNQEVEQSLQLELLNLFLDKNGIMRVGGRLIIANIEFTIFHFGGSMYIPAIIRYKKCGMWHNYTCKSHALTHIINCCIAPNYFPSAWKVSIVKPSPKIKNPMKLNDYRPISILPVFAKTFETMLLNQMQSYVNENYLLSQFQSGFRAGHTHSTCIALLCVSNDILKAIDKKEFAKLVSLDFTSAFDSVNHNLLIQKLNSLFKFSPNA